MEQITNITDLRNSLIKLYEKNTSGDPVNHKELNAITNTAGRIISTSKMQLKYQAHMELQEEIPFLATPKT